MNFTNLVESKITNISQTVGAINSLGEFIVSQFNHLANFCSGIGENASVYVNDLANEAESRLVRVTRQQYDAACENDSEIFALPYNDEGDTINVTGEQIADAFEHQLSELKVQEQYINYCLKTESPSSTEFLTRVRALCPNIAGATVDKFASLIEVSVSPLECIKSFISLIKGSEVTHENTYITLVNKDDYTGNIWVSAFNQVVNTVASFFDGVWEGITKLDKFFKNLLNALIKFGKWLLSRLFHNLTTVYEKASGAVSGIMDLPLAQIHFSKANLKTVMTNLASYYSQATYSWDGYNHCLPLGPIMDEAPECIDGFADSIENLTYDVYDNVKYASVTEIVVPSSNWLSMCMRIGRINDTEMVLNLYAVSDYDTWSKLEDDEIQEYIQPLFADFLKEISSVVPLVTGEQNTDDTSNAFTTYAADYISTVMENVELVQRLMCYNSYVNLNYDMQYQVLCMLLYMCIMSKGFIEEDPYNPGQYLDLTNTYLQDLFFSSTVNLYNPDPRYAQYITNLSNESIDLSVVNSSTWRPYSKTTVLPVTVHYQTTTERAQEILVTIRNLLLAAVVVVATVKVLKWTKARKKESVLVHANVDRLSWDVMANPTQSNITAFNKAYSKAKRFDFVQNILGLTVSNGSTLIGNLVTSVTSGLGSTSSTTRTAISDSESSTVRAINSVKALIKD